MSDPSLTETLRKAMADFHAQGEVVDRQSEAMQTMGIELQKGIQELRKLAQQVNVIKGLIDQYGDPTSLTSLEEAALVPLPEVNAHLWQAMKRTEAIVMALQQLGKPAGPTELALYLADRGRPGDTAANVSATLSHLAESGRVRALGNGTWEPGHPMDEIVRKSPSFRNVHAENAPGE